MFVENGNPLEWGPVKKLTAATVTKPGAFWISSYFVVDTPTVARSLVDDGTVFTIKLLTARR